jgi:hypothetical protein
MRKRTQGVKLSLQAALLTPASACSRLAEAGTGSLSTWRCSVCAAREGRKQFAVGLSSLRMLALFLLVGAALYIASVPAAHAQVVYTYQGQPFTNFYTGACPPECSITGYFVVQSPLPPNINSQYFPSLIGFGFTAGSVLLEQPCTSIQNCNAPPYPFTSMFSIYKTDGSGNIVNWCIILSN